MSLIGYSRVSCTNCGRKFYSPKKELSKSSSKQSERGSTGRESREKTTFESLIQQIEAAERHSGLKQRDNGEPSSDFGPAEDLRDTDRKDSSSDDPQEAESHDTPLVSRKHGDRSPAESRSAPSQETRQDSPSLLSPIELPVSSLEASESSQEKMETRASGDAFGEEMPGSFESTEVEGEEGERDTSLPEIDSHASERSKEEKIQKRLESRPGSSSGESSGASSQDASPEAGIAPESTVKKKPVPETLNNYDLLTLLPKRKKK